MFSLIQTAIENGLDPYKYLTWLLKKANNVDLTQAEEVQKLLSWNASAGCRATQLWTLSKYTKEQDMRLEQSDAELFYQLWFPLLDFVNRKYHVCPKTGTIDQKHGVDACGAKAIADYLWSHIEVIEEYLAAAKLPNEYAQIVAGWKQCKSGRYILERHLKKGSVFISAEDGAVYMVKGLFSTWAEMLGESPVLLDAVLIPFRGSIISDGLVVPYRICFGKGAIEDFKEVYMNAKRNRAIRFSI